MSLPEFRRRSCRQTKGNPPNRYGYTRSDFDDDASTKSLELTKIRKELQVKKLQLELTLLENREAELAANVECVDGQESVKISRYQNGSVCDDVISSRVCVPPADGNGIPRCDVLRTSQEKLAHRREHVNQPFTSKFLPQKEMFHKLQTNPLERDKIFDSQEKVQQWLCLDKVAHSTPLENTNIPKIKTSDQHDGIKENDSHMYMNMMNTFVARQTRMDLPKFNGSPEDWPLFSSEYVRTSHIGKFTIQENVIRLRVALKDDALEAVKSLLILPDSADRVMEILERRFGRPEYIIKSLISKTHNIPPPREDRPLSIVKFATGVENLTVMLELMGRPEYLQNPQLLEELERKLPPIFNILWSEHIVDKPIISLRVFSDWLERKSYAASLRTTLFQEPPFSKIETRRTKGKVNTASAETVPEEITKCKLCSLNCKSLDLCKKFLEMRIDDRWQYVKNLSLCFACLKRNHHTRTCRRKNPCNVDSCQGKHHNLLHNPQRTSSNLTQTLEVAANIHNPYASSSQATVIKGVCTNGSAVTKTVTRLRILPVSLKNNSVVMNTFALLDPGATLTLISESVANELKMNGTHAPLSIQWANGDVANEDESKVGSICISGTFNKARTYTLHDVRTVKHLPLQSQTVNREKLVEKWPYLQRIDFEGYENVQPTILIGENNGLLTATRQLIHSKNNNPIASRTWLGWTISGNDGSNKHSELGHVHYMNPSEDEDLHLMVKSSFQLDDVLTKSCSDHKRSREDERALDIMKATTIKTEGNRWQTGLLWKYDVIKLPDSKFAALQRLYLLEKKLDKSPILKAAYSDIIDGYLKKKYLTKAKEEDLRGDRTWYLPHFPVINPMKSNKVRVVLDAAAKSSGVSLNDVLIQGPDLLQALPGVLFKFRQGAVGFTGDIREMFHRIMIREDDSKSQLILWRGEDRTKDPQVYKMTAMMFGATCSPSSAIYVKDRNADEYAESYPDAVRAIQQNHYMDDYLGSADDDATAAALIRDVIRVHSLGGFEIRNWSSSSQLALKGIPVDLANDPNHQINIDKGSNISRVLGISWNTESDAFTFASNFAKIDDCLLNGQDTPTKRQVLKIVMSIFDPLGFVAHFVIVGKMLLQAIWKTSIDWDDKLPDDLEPMWTNWLNDLKKISVVKIPRCYSPFFNIAPELELHVFVDASESAYAAVAYVRIVVDMYTKVSFVAAKAKVLPPKPLMTIPRAELQAAVLGSRLAKIIKSQHDRPFNKIIFWTDSTTVYHWINSEAKRFKLFVANRLSEISDLTNVSDWKWLPTSLNVADEATRMTRKEFTEDCRWYKGPSFLYDDSRTWPKRKLCDSRHIDTETEVNDFVGVISEAEHLVLPIVTKFSSWLKLIRTTAWILRYINNLKLKSKTKREKSNESIPFGDLTVIELDKAEALWIRQSQQNSFLKEISDLTKTGVVSRSSKLYNLSPKLDEEGIIRLKGRMSNLKADVWLKTPVVLAGRNSYVRLLIEFYHDQANHIGHDGVLNELKQRYWILKVKPTLRQIKFKCNTCKIRLAKPEQTIMGQLPPVRLLSGNPAFTFTGVDYFGPMMVKVGRHLEKRYGVLFTCLSVRAIHIEVAASLTTDSCIMALRRFVSRRGCPLKLFSDNGTNLRGADAELKECLKQLDQNQIRGALTKHRIDWHFIPPASPHMGGCWERLVRSVKTALHIVLKEVNPTDETLATLLTEVEQMINARPLVEVPYHPDEPEALTPNHFLIGRSSASAPISDFDDKDLILRKRWRMSQRLADHFWNRWRKEFLPGLNQRKKWKTPSDRKVQVGDVVLLFNEGEPRGNWPKGVISKVYPGLDGEVRVVDVMTTTGTYKRPIVKICVLDLENGNSGDASIPEGRM